MSVEAKVVVKASDISGMPTEDHFRVETRSLPPLQENEVLFKSLFVSPDPYQRGRLYSSAIGSIVFGSTVAEVIESKHPKLQVGDIIVPHSGWVTHGILNEEQVATTMVHNKEFGPPSTAVGVLGMPGMTAYLGFQNVCQPQAGETVVVSGAAGAVGSLVGQIAKIKGCTVIGIAGGAEKCAYIKSIGFDHAIDYKGDVRIKAALDALAPAGVDCFFDNVGGEAMDAVLTSLKAGARIAVCGQISEYNQLGSPSTGPRLYYNLIYKNAKIEGFLVHQWKKDWPQGLQQMAEWIKEGKIQYVETIEEGGIEATPKAFISLFTGANTGKQLVKLTE